MDTGWYCSECGKRDASEIVLYQSGEMFNAQSKRLNPTCAACGASVEFYRNASGPVSAPSAKVLIISGTCASGKTTLSYLLSEHHGFVQVDGDWILHKLKDEREGRVEGDDIHDDLIRLTEGLVFLGHSVALAHVILPEFLHLYETRFQKGQMDYETVILMPRESVVLSRNAHRKCWPTTTPEYWVLKFHHALADAPDAFKTYFYDNSNETPEETVANLCASLGNF